MKLSFKILGPLFVVLALACCGIGLWAGGGITETVESTIFILITVFVLVVLPVTWLCSRRPWLRNLRGLSPLSGSRFGILRFSWLRNLRRPPPLSDPQLGTLHFSFGFETCLWRGSIVLSPQMSIPLAVAGSCDGPDDQALAIARDLVAQFSLWKSAIEKELFGHYEPYAEAIASGELEHTGDPLPKITESSDVWPLISWVYAAVIPLGGDFVTELGLTVPWDEEHTLGLRFQAGKFVELNGSVVQP